MGRCTIADVAMLIRWRVSLMVAGATFFGAMLAVPHVTITHLLASLATFLLAGGCSAINQVQEADLDAVIPRTASRPIPCGRIGHMYGSLMGLALVSVGWMVLCLAGGLTSLLVGIGIVAVYNGLYTPLKRRTSFALLVGAAAGAMPPVVGWLAVGGHPASPMLVVVYTLYLLWQIPHFWLHAARDREAYRKARLPLPLLSLPHERYARLLKVWFHAYAVAVLMVPAFPLLEGVGMRIMVTLCGIALLFAAMLAVRKRRVALHIADAVLCAVMVVLLIDRLAIPVSLF